MHNPGDWLFFGILLLSNIGCVFLGAAGMRSYMRAREDR